MAGRMGLVKGRCSRREPNVEVDDMGAIGKFSRFSKIPANELQSQTVGDIELGAVSAAKPRKLLLRTAAIVAGAAMITIAVTGFAWNYWNTGRFEVSTDDAYVAADSTAVAPKVSGHIKDVLVADNQPVKAGQVLARIDDSDFKTALAQAQANVAAASADVGNLKAQIEQQLQAVTAARSNITADQAAQLFAQQDHDRYADLVKTGYGTVQKVQLSQSAIAQANAAVQRDQAMLAGAQKQSDVLRAQLTRAEAELQRDQALLDQAQLNLSYATVVAAVDGTVGARSLPTCKQERP